MFQSDLFIFSSLCPALATDFPFWAADPSGGHQTAFSDIHTPFTLSPASSLELPSSMDIQASHHQGHLLSILLCPQLLTWCPKRLYRGQASSSASRLCRVILVISSSASGLQFPDFTLGILCPVPITDHIHPDMEVPGSLRGHGLPPFQIPCPPPLAPASLSAATASLCF